MKNKKYQIEREKQIKGEIQLKKELQTKIEERKIESLTEYELMSIIKNDYLRKRYIKELEKGIYSIENWNHFSEKFNTLAEKYPDVIKASKIAYLFELERKNLKEYIIEYLVPKTSVKIDKIESDRKKYWEDIKMILKNPPTNLDLSNPTDEILNFIIMNKITYLSDLLDFKKLTFKENDVPKVIEYLKESNEGSIPIITNHDIIKYVIKNKKQELYNKIDINTINSMIFTQEEYPKVIEMIRIAIKERGTYYRITNQKLIRYILNHNIEDLFDKIDSHSFNEISFNKEEYPNVIEILKKGSFWFFDIVNKDLIMYIVKNNIQPFGITTTITLTNKNNLTEEEMSQIYRYIQNKGIIKIKCEQFIKYIIKNNLKVENVISLDRIDMIKFKEEEIPKVVEFLKSQYNNSLVSIEYIENNKMLIDYIVRNEIFELFPITKIEKLDLNKEVLEKIFKYYEQYKDKINTQEEDSPWKTIEYLKKQNPIDLDKLLELLKVRKLSNKDIKNINESFQQKIYRQKNKEVIEIFNDIKRIAEREDISIGEKEKYVKKYTIALLETNCIPEIFENELANKNKSISYITMKKLLLEEILTKVIVDNNYKPYLDILHEITQKYISQKGNEYLTNHDIYSIPDIIITYDIEENKREIKRKIFNYLNIKNPKRLHTILKEVGYKDDKIEGNLYKEARELFLTWYDKKCQEEGNNSIIPNQLKYLLFDSDFNENLKKEIGYTKRSITVESFLNHFELESLQTIFNDIIKNSKKYQKLLEIISKYKVLEWPNIFRESMNTITDEDIPDMYELIKGFNAIYEKNNKRQIDNFINSKEYTEILKILKNKYKESNVSEEEQERLIGKTILDQLNGTFSINPYQILIDYYNLASMNTVYKSILGKEDYELIKENPLPNAAHRSGDKNLSRFNLERLEASIDQYLKTIKITHNTIPSIIITIKLDNGKKIKISVGNRTTIRNLTLGERTGSCMRIFGVGEELYKFCNNDSRGFHIIFEDPITGKFISRISGYRNGNTLFLNQLRESNMIDYTNKDIIEASKKISEIIIDISNKLEKELPIENIIADYSYALLTEQPIPTPFLKNDVQIPQYSDVGSGDIVILATKNSNKTLSPIITKKDNQPLYPSARSEPEIYWNTNNEVEERIKRIQAIDFCKKKKEIEKPYREIQYNEKRIEYIGIVISDDWYVMLNKDNEIVILNASSDERAKEEIEKAIQLLEERKKEKKDDRRKR